MTSHGLQNDCAHPKWKRGFLLCINWLVGLVAISARVLGGKCIARHARVIFSELRVAHQSYRRRCFLSSCHNRQNHTSATFYHYHHNSQRLDLNFERHFYPYLWVLSCYALILKCVPLLAIYSLLIVGFSYSCWCLWGSLEAILWNTTKHAPTLTSWRTIFLCKSARHAHSASTLDWKQPIYQVLISPRTLGSHSGRNSILQINR